MEMGEHSPSHRGSAGLPTACCERPKFTPLYGTYGQGCLRGLGWGRVKSVEVPWLSKSIGNCINWPAKP